MNSSDRQTEFVLPKFQLRALCELYCTRTDSSFGLQGATMKQGAGANPRYANCEVSIADNIPI